MQKKFKILKGGKLIKLKLKKKINKSFKTPAEEIIDDFIKNAPDIMTREKLIDLMGNVITKKTLANLDSCGKGIGEKLYIGRKRCYRKSDAIDWLKQRIRYENSDQSGKKSSAN